MARQAPPEEPPKGAPAWTATFGDLMNLLLCFFVLLYAFSSTDVDKFEAIAASMSKAFSIFDPGGNSVGEGDAIGNGVRAKSENQFVVGNYNTWDTNGDYVFIVGNGSDYYHRSNALTVGLNGVLNAAGDIYANNKKVSVEGHTHTPASIGAAAASHTHSYLPLGGGTMTGQIKMKDATAMPRATGTGWYPVVMDAFGDGGGLRYMNPGDVPALIGAAADDHKHAASDVTSGSFGVARGGTGRSTLTSGSYLVGNGTSAVALKTPAQVLSDIGAAAASSVAKSALAMNDHFTVASGFSVQSGDLYKAGTVAVSMRIGIHTANALTSGTDYTVGTLASGLRPHANMYLTANDSKYFNTWVTSNGVLHVKPSANVSAGSNMFFTGTWVIG